MSLTTRSVPIVTDGSGNCSRTIRSGGAALRAIDFELGTLSTPDIDITEEPDSTVLLSVDGQAADARWLPLVAGQGTDGSDGDGFTPPIVMDRIQIEISGGGASRTGKFTLLLER